MDDTSVSSIGTQPNSRSSESTKNESSDIDTTLMNETAKAQNDITSEQDTTELKTIDILPSETLKNTTSCNDLTINEKTDNVSSISQIPLPNCTNTVSSPTTPKAEIEGVGNVSQIPLPNSTCTTHKIDFVTEEEVAESLKKKEENDSLSLNGSCMSGSISQISGSLKTSKFDSSLDALMAKKNQLIDSIKSVLANSSNNLDISLHEDRINDPNTSLLSESETFDLKANNIGTSTPFRESKPPAARFLKKWKPSFLQEEFHVLDEVGISDGDTGYEKEMASLQEVLSESADTASKLESYSNMLDAFKEEDAKKYDQMILTITSEKNPSLEECLEDATKEVDQFIEEFSEKNIGQLPQDTQNNTVITIDSRDTTLVPSVEIITISDVDETIKAVPETNPITINSSQNEKEITTGITEREQLPIKSEPVPAADFEAKPTENQVNQVALPAPKENDPDILIIGGDDDPVINIDDEGEDLLLASDEEGKDSKAENKKVPPQVPLVKELEVFVSSDPDENRDNNDPKWDYLRNLGSDFERYKAVGFRWKNFQPPNPKKDLTCRCRKSTISYNGNLPSYGDVRTSRKRPHSPDMPWRYGKRMRRESCTMLFERSIDQLAHEVQMERINLRKEQEQALNQLADIQEMEKMMAKQKASSDIEMRRLENKHIVETRNCLEEYHMRMNETMEAAKAKLTALRQASDEVRQFHEFYPNEDARNGDKNSLVFLTDSEVQEILEVEEMLLSFPAFYNA